MGSNSSKKSSELKSPTTSNVEEEEEEGEDLCGTGSSSMEEHTQKKHVKFTFPDPNQANVEDICSKVDSLKLDQDDDNGASGEPPENTCEDLSKPNPLPTSSSASPDPDEKSKSTAGEAKESPKEEEAKPNPSPTSSSALPDPDEKSKSTAGEAEESSDEEDAKSSTSDNSEATLKELEVPEECLQGESVIVEYRAKLFRFRAEKKEWIEKGLGKITLLQSLSDHKKCRVVMWNDGNGLLACNFALFRELNVDNFQNNPKALFWKCQECNLAWETYSCRFKNEEECADFKTKLLQYSKDPPEVSHVISLMMENEIANAVKEKAEAVTYGAEVQQEKEEGETTCTGCRGCENSGFEFPKPVQVKEDEPIINFALGEEDGSNDLPTVVPPTMFN